MEEVIRKGQNWKNGKMLGALSNTQQLL